MLSITTHNLIALVEHRALAKPLTVHSPFHYNRDQQHQQVIPPLYAVQHHSTSAADAGHKGLTELRHKGITLARHNHDASQSRLPKQTPIVTHGKGSSHTCEFWYSSFSALLLHHSHGPLLILVNHCVVLLHRQRVELAGGVEHPPAQSALCHRKSAEETSRDEKSLGSVSRLRAGRGHVVACSNTSPVFKTPIARR
jgi:hypothetical protein